MNKLLYIWQKFIYGVLKRRPSIDFSKIPTQLSLDVHYDKKNKVYWLDCKELPEFIVSAKDPQDFPKHIADTLMTYFDVPMYFAKDYPNGEFSFVNPKTGNTEVIKVNKKELSRVLA